ncbi:Protein of unknown function [Paenimyroides aquimaris]|uniref:DUF3050 domain-containing protein n=1 Tax=Paenimyroides marinum TaxID=1159016 RepID=A0A1H6M471_9FLAO|nr:DUF3050 domain-containing protein [Paenimyroides aquimaris]SEH96110.1 Protein of unknown function [Paenimyroides aquimaris]
MKSIAYINTSIQPLKNELINHSLYQKIQTVNDLKLFMQGHVYAVWDFMSLLKALQTQLTCTTSPWFASPNPNVRYLINEIVLAEESDIAMDGTRLSHFEMYLKAMAKSGTSTKLIEDFIASVVETDVFTAIENSALHQNIKDFLRFTFQVIENGKAHEIAAAFTFGREDLIPAMFTEILKGLNEKFPDTDLSELVYYFERHIELDADEHGPMAFEMISYLCDDDPLKWNEVLLVAQNALKQRVKLWHAIEALIDQQKDTEA